jgi:hypothetical protein
MAIKMAFIMKTLYIYLFIYLLQRQRFRIVFIFGNISTKSSMQSAILALGPWFNATT